MTQDDGYSLTHPPGRGFSLFELMLVLAIVATLAAVVAPRYSASLARYRVETAAQKITADLRMAQTRARTTSSTQAVVFTIESNLYQLPGVVDLVDPSSDYTVTLSQQPYESTLVSADFGGSNQVVFDGWGIPDSGGSIVVRAGGNQKTITINAETGGVTVQ